MGDSTSSNKPAITRGAELVLFFGLLVPAVSLFILLGAILLLEHGTLNKVFGALLIVSGLAGLAFSLVRFFQKRGKG